MISTETHPLFLIKGHWQLNRFTNEKVSLTFVKFLLCWLISCVIFALFIVFWFSPCVVCIRVCMLSHMCRWACLYVCAHVLCVHGKQMDYVKNHPQLLFLFIHWGSSPQPNSERPDMARPLNQFSPWISCPHLQSCLPSPKLYNFELLSHLSLIMSYPKWPCSAVYTCSLGGLWCRETGLYYSIVFCFFFLKKKALTLCQAQEGQT